MKNNIFQRKPIKSQFLKVMNFMLQRFLMLKIKSYEKVMKLCQVGTLLSQL